jgi:hypothetical protein
LLLGFGMCCWRMGMLRLGDVELVELSARPAQGRHHGRRAVQKLRGRCGVGDRQRILSSSRPVAAAAVSISDGGSGGRASRWCCVIGAFFTRCGPIYLEKPLLSKRVYRDWPKTHSGMEEPSEMDIFFVFFVLDIVGPYIGLLGVQARSPSRHCFSLPPYRVLLFCLNCCPSRPSSSICGPSSPLPFGLRRSSKRALLGRPSSEEDGPSSPLLFGMRRSSKSALLGRPSGDSDGRGASLIA